MHKRHCKTFSQMKDLAISALFTSCPASTTANRSSLTASTTFAREDSRSNAATMIARQRKETRQDFCETSNFPRSDLTRLDSKGRKLHRRGTPHVRMRTRSGNNGFDESRSKERPTGKAVEFENRIKTTTLVLANGEPDLAHKAHSAYHDMISKTVVTDHGYRSSWIE